MTPAANTLPLRLHICQVLEEEYAVLHEQLRETAARTGLPARLGTPKFGQGGCQPVPPLTPAASAAQYRDGWGQADFVRRPPWDPTEKKL